MRKVSDSSIAAPDPDNATIIMEIIGKKIEQDTEGYRRGARRSREEYFLHIHQMAEIISTKLNELFYEHNIDHLLDSEPVKEKLNDEYTGKFILVS